MKEYDDFCILCHTHSIIKEDHKFKCTNCEAEWEFCMIGQAFEGDTKTCEIKVYPYRTKRKVVKWHRKGDK